MNMDLEGEPQPRYYYEEEEQVREHWECVMSSSISPMSDTRSSYHLYVYPQERDEKWALISMLTGGDRLGYMSSISPDIMNGGPHEGALTISVHHDNSEAEAVRNALIMAGLGDRIFHCTPTPKRRSD